MSLQGAMVLELSLCDHEGFEDVRRLIVHAEDASMGRFSAFKFKAPSKYDAQIRRFVREADYKIKCIHAKFMVDGEPYNFYLCEI